MRLKPVVSGNLRSSIRKSKLKHHAAEAGGVGKYLSLIVVSVSSILRFFASWFCCRDTLRFEAQILMKSIFLILAFVALASAAVKTNPNAVDDLETSRGPGQLSRSKLMERRSQKRCSTDRESSSRA